MFRSCRSSLRVGDAADLSDIIARFATITQTIVPWFGEYDCAGHGLGGVDWLESQQ